MGAAVRMIILLSRRCAGSASRVVAKVKVHQDNTGPFSAPAMLLVPLFSADWSLDRALRKIESKIARHDSCALRTIPGRVSSESPPPCSAVQAPAPADEYYGTSNGIHAMYARLDVAEPNHCAPVKCHMLQNERCSMEPRHANKLHRIDSVGSGRL
ncbi:uncharacterized protein LAESUDRAFT_723741 [Laetiporus sulphureus 93-53]|uniref:Uncharacterized protein n=1 Tax=Laetiporus sulphureus 93-53 TaxID=1314785 RepID=A0A165FDH0_9APHY|nr:uncharacterized protein LAESUDRAFT_723741 [Laetiporus sulphureus 93-53]KZT08803.1 hypothetical protein LAESUDRAFT_723741 [Laetiporus sulphureus 93-53]